MQGKGNKVLDLLKLPMKLHLVKSSGSGGERNGSVTALASLSGTALSTAVCFHALPVKP